MQAWRKTDFGKNCNFAQFVKWKNIVILQNAIRKGVYDKSNEQYIIGPQNYDELKIIMRSIYLEHANNLPYDIKNQITQLNKLVVKFCVEQIYKAAIGYIKYKYILDPDIVFKWQFT